MGRTKTKFEMAKPWPHPETGVFHIRRQIPEALRPAFGGRQLHKKTLGTKDPKQAAVLFLQANAELEAQFELARTRLAATGSPLPSARDHATALVQAYFNGPAKAPGGLDGPGRLLLARLELDRGLWNGAFLADGSRGCTTVAPSTTDEWSDLANNAALCQGHRGTLSHIGGSQPGAVWQRRDLGLTDEARAKEIDRLIEQIARHCGTPVADLPGELADELQAFLDALPVASGQTRRICDVPKRLRPDTRLTELFDAWQEKRSPSRQTTGDYRASIADLIDYLGDVPVSQLTEDDVLNYRDAAEKLPAAMPKADRLLPFTERLARIPKPEKGKKPKPTISAATLKKRIGGLQAILGFAKQEGWITANVAAGVSIGKSKDKPAKRRTFDEQQLQRLFGSPLFIAPDGWSWRHKTTDCTLYWLFLIACLTGARIEEIGQALLADVKWNGSILYIDIDDYVAEPDGEADDEEPDETDAGEKSVKTATSRRLVPIHDRIVALGFGRYCEALRASGQVRVFPDLDPNMFGKRTQDASKRANGVINRLVSKDPRLVFHSFRHGFKDLATEAGLSERVVDQICGHAPTSTGGKYGRGVRLPALSRFLHAVDWSFLDWDLLTKAAEKIDWQVVASKHADRRV